MRAGIRRVLGKVYVPAVKRYLAKARSYAWQDIRLQIQPGVFHPGLFYSTHLLLEYMENFPLTNKSLLELGAGSGLISMYAAKKGATVTALDISTTALDSIAENAKRNQVELHLVHSDLFTALPVQPFDYIIINPPYYPAEPKKESDYAWYAGAGLQYFDRLFAGLGDYVHTDSKVIMVLSEDCDLATIQAFAKKYGFALAEKMRKMRMLEWTVIYEINRKA